MTSPRPVVGSISALLIGMVCLTVMYNKAGVLGLSGYQHYIGFGILIAGAYQIIKSGSRSLFLPLFATVMGVTLSHALTKDMTFLTFDADFYRYVMFTGIIGLGNSMFHIE